MKNRVAAVILALCMMPLSPAGAAPAAGLHLSARSALIEDGSGRVLYARNPDAELPNASTTKVLTALVVMDHENLQDVVTVSRNAARQPPTRLGIRSGERYTVLELLYAMLLISANDAAVALAEHVAGSTQRFAVLMNEKARSLGALHSHFVTPNGLPADGHYTTVRDLARIIRAAVNNPVFVAIAQTHTVDLLWPGNHGYHRLVNHNKLLTAYATPILGKTGYTHAAGRCYVGVEEGTNLCVSMLGSRNLWGDVRRLFNYGMKIEGASRYSQKINLEAARGPG